MTTPKIDQRLVNRKREFLLCGDFGHLWQEPEDDQEWKIGEVTRAGKPRTVFREVTCSRCGTVRKDIYTVTPWKWQRHHYDYPEGYRIRGNGQPKLRRDDTRYARFVAEFLAVLEEAAANQSKTDNE